MANQMPNSDVQGKIQEWLMNDGWSLRKQSYPGVTWAWVAQDQFNRKIIVGQKADRQDELLIQAAITIDDNTKAKIEHLPGDERNDLLWDLRFELLRTELDFKGVEIPLKVIEVMTRISSDTLTKDAFRHGISLVGKGILIVQWMLMRKFQQQPSSRQIGFQR